MASTGKTRTDGKRRNQGGGYIYAITNPAWPGFTKIGRTTNITSRHRTYQTASPLRDFKLHYARWFPDVCLAERTLRTLFSGHPINGEWRMIHAEDASNLIDLTFSRLSKEQDE